MIKKIISTVLILLFIGGGAAVGTELQSQTSLTAAELPTDNDLGVMAETGVRGAANDGVCVLSIDSTTDSKLAIKCGVEEDADQTGFLEATLESSGDRSEYSPESIAVVHESDRCPGSRVCYELQSGSIDLGVFNEAPTAKRGPLYEGDAVGGESAIHRGEMSNTISVVTYGSYSISKRSARTGRNPQTDTKALKKGDRLNKRSDDEDGNVYSWGSGLMLEDVQGDMEFGSVTLKQEVSDESSRCLQSDKCYDRVYVGDLDADGLSDLAVEYDSTNVHNWTVSNDTFAKATANTTQVGATRIIFVQVEGADQQSMNKAELIEAMASHAGLSKADSKKALEGFVDTTTGLSVKNSECCFDYDDRRSEQGSMSSGGMDRTTPKLYQELEDKNKRIAELERQIAELEADGNISASAKASPEQGNDRVVRKKPGRTVTGEDMDSDNDGVVDAEETEELENKGNSSAEDRRPGFVNRLLGSIFG